MPKIPVYERKLSIPGESGGVFQNIGAAGSEWGSLAQAGKNLMDEAGKTLSIIKAHKEKLRKQDIENKALLAASAYNEEQRTFRQSEEQITGEEAYQNMERGTKFRDDSIAKYTKDITDPDLKAKIQNHILSKSESLFDKLSAHQATQRQEVTKKAVEGIKSGLLKDAYEGDDLDECIEEFQNTVKRQFQTGARGELSSIDEIVKGESAIAEAHLDGLINRSPAAGIEAIKSGKYKQFLTQKQIEGYDKKAKDLSEALKKDAETARKDAEQAIKDKLKAEREATGNEFVSRLVSGKLTRSDILKSNLEPTGENGKQYWINQVEQNEKRRKEGTGAGGGETFKTDKVIEKNLYIGIQTEKDINKLHKLRYDVLNAYSSGKLSKSSADSLITDIDKKVQPEKEKQGLGDKTQKDIIIKRIDDDYEKGILGKKGSDEAAQLLIDLSRSYEEWAARPENKGKPHLEWYQTVMKPYNEKTIKTYLKSPYQTMFGEGDPNPRRALSELEKTKKSDPLGIRN